MPAVVVTGASGFLGRAFCSALAEQGQEVLAVHRSGYTAPGVQALRVKEYSETPAPQGAVCVHFAGENVAGAVTADEPGKTAEAVDLVKSLLAKPFARFVLVSSAAVYGARSGDPHREGGRAQPDSPYGRLKLAVEDAALPDERVIVARIANAYGPGMPEANVLSSILRQLPGKDALHLQNLTSVRDYIHVQDIARALQRFALGHAAPGIYNVGSGLGSSVGRLLEIALAAIGQPDRKISVEDPHAPPSRLVLDASKLRALGWSPEISLQDGLKPLVRKNS